MPASSNTAITNGVVCDEYEADVVRLNGWTSINNHTSQLCLLSVVKDYSLRNISVRDYTKWLFPQAICFMQIIDASAAYVTL
jgi:hypothetical protein